ncbi:1520_t:CDS:2 [Racocetra persica]|uniref:1520_t:CDS:1 n=1 Tax=Racocetra persica TaxID=160502 RepID=A0ACA9LJI4_9GLOM|nr:1520_t:CDS:2 [Racocetra persica]
MLPPPSEVYKCADELFQSIQKFTNSQGYALVKKRTWKDECGKLKNMTLRCDRGGVYSNSLELSKETYSRQKSTRLIDHLFKLWHPIVRRLTEQQIENVVLMTIAGSSPHEIVLTIQQNNPSALALVDELQEDDFLYKYKCDNTGSVTHLFFAYKESTCLIHQYPTVILIDCIYKTNKFKMPLLSIVGITSFNTTFYTCFMFMKSEEETDYNWALTNVLGLFDEIEKPSIIVTDRELALMNTLRMIFPNSTNILCQGFLAKWNDIIQSNTEDEFDEKWINFYTTYINKPSVVSIDN